MTRFTDSQLKSILLSNDAVSDLVTGWYDGDVTDLFDPRHQLELRRLVNRALLILSLEKSSYEAASHGSSIQVTETYVSDTRH